MAGVWVLLETLKRVLPPIPAGHWWWRISPILPILLCSAGVWIPGIEPEDITPISRILTGLIIGYAVYHSHKVVFQAVLGKEDHMSFRPGEKAVIPEKTSGGSAQIPPTEVTPTTPPNTVIPPKE